MCSPRLGKPFLKGSDELGLLGRYTLIVAQTKTGRTPVDKREEKSPDVHRKRGPSCPNRAKGPIMGVNVGAAVSLQARRG